MTRLSHYLRTGNCGGYFMQNKRPNIHCFPSSRVIIKSKCIHSSVKVKAAQLCLTLCDPSPWNSPGQNTGVGNLSFLQGILPTQRSNLGFPHYRQIFYQLSHKGSPHSSSSVIMSKNQGMRVWVGRKDLSGFSSLFAVSIKTSLTFYSA